MKSVQKLAERQMLRTKKGQVGLDTAKSVMLALLTIGVIAFAILIALGALQDSAPASVSNDTGQVVGNITSGVVSFFSNTTTWFALLAVVIIILIIAIVIFAVNRFGGRTGGL